MDASSPSPDIALDLRGLKCQMPVLRTRRALRRAPIGARLSIACTDPLAIIDIPHMVREDGHALERQTVAGGVSTFVIRKRGSAAAP